MQNFKFGKIKPNGSIEYAPAVPTVGTRMVFNARREDYAAANDGPWLPIVDDPPSAAPAEGYHWEASGCEERNGALHRVYSEVANPAPALSDYDAAMEAHLLAEREARGYTTREPDAYRNSSVARWRQDAADWSTHRDSVMLYAQEIMNAVSAGTREPPTMAEFTAGLPRIAWTYREEV